MKKFNKLFEDYTDFLNKTDIEVCGKKHTFKEGDKVFVQYTGCLNPDVKDKTQWTGSFIVKTITKDNMDLEALVKTFGDHDVESEKAIDKDDYFKEVNGNIKIKTKDITKISWGDDYWIVEITNYEPEEESEIELEKSKDTKIVDKEKESKPEVNVQSGKINVKMEKNKGELNVPPENKDLKKINKANESVIQNKDKNIMETGSLFANTEKTKFKNAYLQIIAEEMSPLQPKSEEGLGDETADASAAPIEPEMGSEGDMDGGNELSEIGQEMDKKTKAHFDKLKNSLDKNDEERMKMLNKTSEDVVKLIASKKLTKKEIIGILREVIRELE